MVSRAASWLNRHHFTSSASSHLLRTLRRTASIYLLCAAAFIHSLWRAAALQRLQRTGLSVCSGLAVAALLLVWYVGVTYVQEAADQSASLADVERAQRDGRFYRDGVQQVRHAVEPAALDCSSTLVESLVNNSAYQLSTSPLDPNHPALARLVHWLAPSAQFHSVYIQYDDSGDHCLHALHKIPAGQTVLSVPYSHMLTLDQAKESTIGRQLTQRWDNETSRHAYIAAYVLSEAARGNDGDWWPYLQSLPASTNHLASAWSDDELQWLKGTEALRIAREQQQMVQEAYDQARALPSFTFTFDSYAHARRLIFSRLFSYTAAQGHRSVALVPMIDLLNHATSDRYNTLWTYNTTLQAFTMYTTAPLSAHQPLLTSYGDKSNSELLTSYGFVLETNEWDKAEVGYEGVDGDGEPVTRSAQLTAEYGNSQSQLLMLNMRRYAVQAAIAMLKRRLERVRNETLAGADVQEKQRGLRVQVERLVLHRVADAVRQADDRYGGDRAAEVARLARWTGERGKEWQALVVRVGERRVLQWWLDVCTLGERWLADGVSPAQSWEGERAEVRRLGAQSLVKSVWLVALEDEKAEQARSVPSGVHELR